MQVNKINNNYMSFEAQVSPHFNKVVQNFFNYGNYPNKRKNIYTFIKKSEEFEKFGHNDYIIDYEKQLKNGIPQHYLVALKESKKVILAERDSLIRIIRKFLQMNKGEFNQKIIKGK